jgi:hypothetical protein
MERTFREGGVVDMPKTLYSSQWSPIFIYNIVFMTIFHLQVGISGTRDNLWVVTAYKGEKASCRRVVESRAWIDLDN